MITDRYAIESGSAWYQHVSSELENHRAALDDKRARRYNLELLRRIAWHVDRFAGTCGVCEGLKQDVMSVLAELDTLVREPSRSHESTYRRARRAVSEHLKKDHKLAEPGYYTGIGGVIGTGAGVVLGIIFDGQAYAPIGLAVGFAAGWLLERWMKQRGKVL